MSDKLQKAIALAQEVNSETQFGSHVYLSDVDVSFLVTTTHEDGCPVVVTNQRFQFGSDEDKQLDALITELEAMLEVKRMRERIPAFDVLLSRQALESVEPDEQKVRPEICSLN